MIELVANVMKWTPYGMARSEQNTGYISTQEAERLLEEAHRRGFEAGVKKAAEIVKGV